MSCLHQNHMYLRALHIVPELTRPLADIGEEGDKLTTNLLNRFILGDEVMRGPEPSLRAEEDQERVKLGTQLRTPPTMRMSLHLAECVFVCARVSFAEADRLHDQI